MSVISLLEELVSLGVFVKCNSCCNYIYKDSLDFSEVVETPNGNAYCGYCKGNVSFCADCDEEGYEPHSNGNNYCNMCLPEEEEE
jgi:hypothetical protein